MNINIEQQHEYWAVSSEQKYLLNSCCNLVDEKKKAHMLIFTFLKLHSYYLTSLTLNINISEEGL